jgi:acyl carrier protein
MKDDIADRVRELVIAYLDVAHEKVTEGANFVDDLGADSLDTIELIMAFEEEFGIEFSDNAAEKIVTIKDAINFISENSI